MVKNLSRKASARRVRRHRRKLKALRARTQEPSKPTKRTSRQAAGLDHYAPGVNLNGGSLNRRSVNLGSLQIKHPDPTDVATLDALRRSLPPGRRTWSEALSLLLRLVRLAGLTPPETQPETPSNPTDL